VWAGVHLPSAVLPRRALPLAMLLAAALLAAAGCGTANPRLSPAMRAWAQGPVRWLMLGPEVHELERLQSDAEARLFIEEFWRRRDPDPEGLTNPARETFRRRVDAADKTYGEGVVRGSMTDRGRALILLGAPPLLRHGHRPAPAPSWRRDSAGPMPVRNLVMESWEYAPRDLWPALNALLDERQESGVTLSFVIEGDRARLVDGEDYLELAAQATVRLVP
jgi:GWxTD domain-containing protein